MEKKIEKEIKDTKTSANLFSISVLCFSISWIMSGFEESMWAILALINVPIAISQWMMYQKLSEKIAERGENDHEEKTDK